MAGYRLSTTAQSDILDILAWSHARFGEEARKRYEALIIAALRDIAAQPDRTGSLERPELGIAVRSWHLRLSRKHCSTSAGEVRSPRHILIYRMESDMVVVGRVLHDAMELERHLDPERSWG